RRPDIVFLLAGAGPERGRLQRICAEERIPSVRFLGPLPTEAIPALFSVARASIVPLRDSPLFESARPSKIMPSLACETAVIYAGRGDAADLLTRNECGIVVPPENPIELARAVQRLADDPQLAARLGKAGR